ncbi:RNA polymerase-associated protein Rtf1 [Drosophila rhopaloa]|uniref:RNA polymerase-associated protein Rtf1-like n=1 Tax=Drosophila rhopaloa TaxID=1041015 RepID=A0A6P4EXI7_DRORH|nr:RNA polymerase-associated protein Rtf1 [Drosophila rhopaloa]
MSTSSKRFRKWVVANVEDLEDESCEVPAKEPEVEQFNGNIMGNAKDRIRLKNLCELDRCLRREDLERKSNIRCQLAQNRLTSQQEEDSGTKEDSQIRRQNLDHQRSGNQRVNDFEDCVGQMDNGMNCPVPQPKENKLRTTDQYSDDSVPSSGSGREIIPRVNPQAEPEELPRVTTREQLSQAVLTRNQLETFLDKPNFEQTVVGCFVRVNICLGSVNFVYQIESLHQGRYSYQLGSKRSNLILGYKYGTEKRYSRMDVVSNHPVTDEEFFRWSTVIPQEKPTLLHIAKKQMDIERAAEYSFPEADVERLVQTERMGSLRHRVQVPSSPRDAHVPTVHRLDLMAPSCSKQSLPERTSKSEELDPEQCMRRKYKKSAVVSRCQVAGETADLQELAQKPEPPKSPNERAEMQDVPELDLYSLHNFKVDIDISGLLPFSSIFPNVKFSSPWKG